MPIIQLYRIIYLIYTKNLEIKSSRFFSSFIGNNTKCIILAHLSEDNNTEELAYNTLIERLNDSDTHVDNIIIAKQNKETELVKLWLRLFVLEKLKKSI